MKDKVNQSKLTVGYCETNADNKASYLDGLEWDQQKIKKLISKETSSKNLEISDLSLTWFLK